MSNKIPPIFTLSIALCGCTSQRTDNLAPVRKAAIRVKAHTAIGVTQLKLNDLLGEFSSEIMLALDSSPSDEDKRRLVKYTEALEVYIAGERFREAALAFEACNYYCEQQKRAKEHAASAAKIDPKLDHSEGVIVIWRMAAQKIDQAGAGTGL